MLRVRFASARGQGLLQAPLRRQFNTFGVRLSGAKPKAKELVRVTGFTGAYLPSKDDFLTIIQAAVRPDVKGFEMIVPKVPSTFDEVFESFEVLPNKTGGGSIVFALKSEEIGARLPFARPLDPKARPRNLSERTAWSGMLLPVLDNNIIHLNGEVLETLQRTKMYARVKWYSLVFSSFRPDVLVMDSVSRTKVLETLEKYDPDVLLGIYRRPPRHLRTSPDERRVILRFESTADLVNIRDFFQKEGIIATPMESERFDLHRAFLASEYRGEEDIIRATYAEPEVPTTRIITPEHREVEREWSERSAREESREEQYEVSEGLVPQLSSRRRRGVSRSKPVSTPSSRTSKEVALEEAFFERLSMTGSMEDIDDFYAIEERVSPFRYEYLSSNGPFDGAEHASM